MAYFGLKIALHSFKTTKHQNGGVLPLYYTSKENSVTAVSWDLVTNRDTNKPYATWFPQNHESQKNEKASYHGVLSVGN